MTLLSPKEIYLRRWWWSKQPFWKYLTTEHRGWANLVDRHPGLFNLAWTMAGGIAPPAAYEPYAAQVTWVFSEAYYIPLAGKTMADWAFYLSLPEFRHMIQGHKREVRRWKFHDKHISCEAILAALDARLTLRA